MLPINRINYNQFKQRKNDNDEGISGPRTRKKCDVNINILKDVKENMNIIGREMNDIKQEKN